jgi:hypothetical protein
VDANVGQMPDAVEKAGVRENTIVIYPPWVPRAGLQARLVLRRWRVVGGSAQGIDRLFALRHRW